MMEYFAMSQPVTLANLLESHGMLRRSQEELRKLRMRFDQAGSYLTKPNCNPHLGRIQRSRIKTQYSAALDDLRRARQEAYRQLGIVRPGIIEPMPPQARS